MKEYVPAWYFNDSRLRTSFPLSFWDYLFSSCLVSSIWEYEEAGPEAIPFYLWLVFFLLALRRRRSFQWLIESSKKKVVTIFVSLFQRSIGRHLHQVAPRPTLLPSARIVWFFLNDSMIGKIGVIYFLFCAKALDLPLSPRLSEFRRRVAWCGVGCGLSSSLT